MAGSEPVPVEFAIPAGREDVDRLLVRVVRPFLASWPPGSAGLFIRTQVGDHPGLLVQLTGDADTAERDLRSALADEPAAGPVTRSDRPTVPLAGGAFAGRALAPLTRKFTAEVTPQLLDMLATSGTRADLLGAAVDVMTAHLAAVNIGAVYAGGPQPTGIDNAPPLSFLSFRSHADGFFLMARDPDAARRAFDDRYEPVAASIRTRVSAVLDQFSGAGKQVSVSADRWHRAVTALLPDVVTAFRSGDLVGEADAGGYLGDAIDLAPSTFHRTVDRNREFVRFLRSDPSMLGVRMMTSLLYLALHNLGLQLVNRYFLCHAISRACESLGEADAAELLERAVRLRGVTPRQCI